jgi:hypothetical protein
MFCRRSSGRHRAQGNSGIHGIRIRRITDIAIRFIRTSLNGCHFLKRKTLESRALQVTDRSVLKQLARAAVHAVWLTTNTSRCAPLATCSQAHVVCSLNLLCLILD